MTHPRTLIRSAFVTRLGQNTAAANQPAVYRTAAGARVYKGRLMPIEEPELPAIVVHTRDAEEVQERSKSGHNGYEQRRCMVSIICIAQSFEDIDADLDTMAQQVEDALQAWVIPGFESSDAMLLDTATEDPDFDGALTTGASTLRYAVTYRTPYRVGIDPSMILDPNDLMTSGAYPGGQITATGHTGAACPIGNATITCNEEIIPMEPASAPEQRTASSWPMILQPLRSTKPSRSIRR